jgi:P4 family phage/plasmid primase-like protien
MNPKSKISKTYMKFNKFLDSCKVSKEDTYTHVSMGEPYGRFFIGEDNKEKFFKLYKKAIVTKKSTYHILESMKQYAPIVCDIDFNVPKEKYANSRCYNEDTIKLCIRLYNNAISNFLKVPMNRLQAFVMEKPSATDKGNMFKDGLHIIYPFVCAKYELRHAIRQHVIDAVEKNDLFSNIELLNDMNNIFDKQSINGTWLLYGSIKKGSSTKYKLTHIYAHDETELPLDTYTDAELIEELSVRKFNSEDEDECGDNIDKSKIINKYSRVNIKTKKDSEKYIEKSNTEILMVKKLLALLNKDRIEDYHKWIELGFCLHNISLSLLYDWIDLSKKSKKFKSGECEDKWKNMRENDFTIRSLYRWAKEDNPIEYEKIIKSNYRVNLEDSLTGQSYDVGKTMFLKYQNSYICSSLKHKTWYEFKDHKWNEIDEGYTLMGKISEEFVNDYLILECEYNTKAIESTGIQKEEWQRKKEMVGKIVTKLRDIRYKEGIMKENRYLFYDPEFEDRLDEQRHLIGFKNGVYDLDRGVFRDGRPEDFISMSTKIDYVEYDKHCDYAKKIDNFFKQIQPKEEMKVYLLKLLSSYLQGHIPDEKFHIATGCGSNGKSLTIDLLMYALGEYAITLPITILIKKRNASNAASPELALIKGKRFGVFQEPEANDKIQVGQMKELTGGDKFLARPLFKDPIIVQPQIKLLLTCNNLPHIPGRDKGTWRRLRVVEFGSEFVENPTGPKQYKIDKTLKQDIENWAPQFISLLIETYKDYKENGLKEPNDVVQFTKKYQQDSDHFLEFISENIEDSDNKKDYVTITSVWDNFKSWFKDVHPDIKQLPSRSELKTYLVDKFGKPSKGGRWSNKILKIDEDSDDEAAYDNVTTTSGGKNELDF